MSYSEFKNNIKGAIGENKIANLLNARKDETYEMFHNLGIPCGDDIQQIDLIYVTKQAVFVIESKNWAGLIRGNATDNNWYSILPGKRNHHYNPIKQNANHIKFLRNIINVKVPIYSLIVFPDLSNISSINILNKYIKIVQYNNLNESIDLVIDNVDYEMSDKKFNEVCEKIEPYNEIDEEVAKKHIEKIKLRHDKTSNVTAENELIDNRKEYLENNNDLKIVALIIIFTLVVCLIVHMVSIYTAKSTYYKNIDNYREDSISNENIVKTEPRNVGWKEINGVWYYYFTNGEMVKNGCVQDNAKIYYMGNDGIMVKNKLVQVGDSYFYFGYDGAMIANTWDPSGQYYFGIDGRLENAFEVKNDFTPSLESKSHKFNIVSCKYFNDTYTKDEEYYSNRCDVRIVIPIFDQQTSEDVMLNNSIRDAVYDIATDIEEEFYNNEYMTSFVLDQYTLIKVNENFVSLKLIGMIDRIQRISYTIEYDRQNQIYSYWNN